MWFRSSLVDREERVLYQRLIKAGASICLLLAALPLAANPTGGNVKAGDASISTNGNTTTIHQTSDRAVIDWNSFSVRKGQTTQFIDPSSSAITLNRVTGTGTSTIMGHLTSNGQIFLINPNGIIFGKGSEVDAAGLLASTANISTPNFMSGNYHFTNAPANSFVINQGNISIANYGLAALVAPSVVNSGTITATLGKVILGAGNAFTLDLYGDGLINFDVSSNGFLVNNPGVISANGGTVMLTASAAGALLENTINTSGIINAQSVSQQNGKVIFSGSKDTTLNISGTVNASGTHTGETGGIVQATAGNVNLLNGSLIDATGFAGGGTVEIGGGPHGTGPLAHAMNVLMDSGATIDASATQSGNGGHVVFWSDVLSKVYGTIMAQGGATSGNGGLVETSGQQLDVTGIQVNTSALHGLTGTWLLDPFNIDVINGSGITGGGFSGTTFVPTSDSTIGALTLSSQLATTNVTLDTCGGSSGCPGASAGNITFDNNINTVNVGNNAFNVYASNNILFNTNSAITGSGSGQITLWSGRQNTGAGTIVTGGGVTAAIAGTNPLQVFYNPAVFGTNDADISNLSPTASANAYSLVYSGVAGRQLSSINGANLAGNYVLAQNIDGSLLGTFTPIGPFPSSFSGKFLGNGFTINDLTVSGAGLGIGLFGDTNGATISGVTLANSVINGGGNNDIGGIVGFALNSTLTNITGTDLTVSGNNNVGGLVGVSNGSTVSNALLLSSNPSNISVNGVSDVGSIVGNNSGSINNAYSNATIQTSGIGGGIAGENSGSTISNVMYTGNIIAATGATEVGGLIGTQETGGNITNSVAAGTFSGPAVSPGFGAIISANAGSTVTSPVYYSTTTYGASTPGIFAGAGAPNFGGAIVGLPSSALTNATTLGLSSSWQTNNPSFQFVSLSFCGSACIANFASPPPPPPPQGAFNTVENTLNNNIATQPVGDLDNGSEENVAAVPTTGDPSSDTVVVTVTPDKLGTVKADPHATAKLGEKFARDRMCH